MILDNQVDFVKCDLISGILQEKQHKKVKKAKRKNSDFDGSNSDSSSDLSEGRLVEEEKKLTPFEKERLALR